ncbi:MAG TPA: serine protease [Terriglobales bacterium]|nr:serine protease [Terriglobales bacterium]
MAASVTIAMFALGFAFGMHVHASKPAPESDAKLAARVNHLDTTVKQLSLLLQQPSNVIAKTRDSVCFIVSTYTLTDPHTGQLPRNPYRLLGSGFLIEGNRVVSNRHVLEPWFGEPNSEEAINAGSIPRRERITAYFPGYSQGVELTDVVVSEAADVAVARVKLPAAMNVKPLHLAAQPSSPGDPVVVIGYPLGVTTMLAKSSAFPFRQTGLRQTQKGVDHLAKFKLIRPSATQGHLVDASDQMLMYDASTAHGSSGGPVFNLQGEVIAVNAAYIDGFNGSSLGVSTSILASLLAQGSK